MPAPGTIDFQQPLKQRGLTIFRSFEQEDRFWLLADTLELAMREGNQPDFVLELVRPQNPLLPPEPYGLLDMRVQAQYRSQEALEVLQQEHPNASVDAAFFESGSMRLAPVGDLNDAPKDLFQPVNLGWNGLGVARFVLRLPLSSTLLLKNALLGEILPLRAVAEMTVTGVSPRLPLKVRFDPARLVGAVAALGNTERQVGWHDIVQFFGQDPETLPLQLISQNPNVSMDEFGESMADHLCHRWGNFVAANEDDDKLYFAFPAPAEVGSGSFDWDLSEPVIRAKTSGLEFQSFGRRSTVDSQCWIRGCHPGNDHSADQSGNTPRDHLGQSARAKAGCSFARGDDQRGPAPPSAPASGRRNCRVG